MYVCLKFQKYTHFSIHPDFSFRGIEDNFQEVKYYKDSAIAGPKTVLKKKGKEKAGTITWVIH